MARRWHTVRVFISSTFRDFHSERDLLTNHIFHELRAWCERRYLHLVEIDLRWGVTQEESNNGKALQICLDELDRSDFFLCLLGSRYGWMPQQYEVGTGSRFDWVRNVKPQTCSVTELEIKRAVLNPPRSRTASVSNAMFYIRDDSFLKEVPLDQLSEFTDGTFSKKGGNVTFTPDRAKQVKVEELRQIVRDGAKSLRDPALKVKIVENYSCKYGGTTKLVGVGAAQPVLTGLEQFHLQVIADLKAAITERYPNTVDSVETKMSELAMNRELVSSYMERRVRNFQGRQSEIEQIVAYAMAPVVDGPMLLSGKAGTGKTALLAKASRGIMSAYRAAAGIKGSISAPHGSNPVPKNNMMPMIMLPFFAGAVPGSLQASNMLRSVIMDLRQQLREIKPREQVDARWSALKTGVKLNKMSNRVAKNSENNTNLDDIGADNRVDSSMFDIGSDDDEDETGRSVTKSLAEVALTQGRVDKSLKQWRNMRQRGGPIEFAGSFERLSEFFKRMLKRACRFATVVLLLDNLGHMNIDDSHTHTLGWLPSVMPANLRIIIATDEHHETLSPTASSNDLLDLQEGKNVTNEGLDRVETIENEQKQQQLELRRATKQNSAITHLTELGEDLADTVLYHVSRHFKSIYKHLRIGGLNRIWAEKLIVRHFQNYGKKLDADQMELLIAKAVDKSPTWLVITCEELRLFPLFERVAERIASIPEDVPSLLDQMISRLEREHGPQFVQDTLSLLVCSRDGLLEHEVLNILGVSQRAWSRLFFGIKPFLHNSLSERNDDLITFSHREWNIAVGKRYRVNNEQQAAHIHRRLATYFLRQAYVQRTEKGEFTWQASKARALWCLPFHLVHSRCFVELEKVLTDLNFIEAKCEAGMNYEWVDDITGAIAIVSTFALPTLNSTHSHSRLSSPQNNQLAVTNLPSENSHWSLSTKHSREMLARLTDFSSFARAFAPELGLNPRLVFQYAANFPDSTVVAQAARQQLMTRRVSIRSWLRWVNKPQETNPCLVTLKGHEGPVSSCAISCDGIFVTSGSADCTVRVWMTQTGEHVFHMKGHKLAVTSTRFSPVDPFTVVSGSRDGTACVWTKGTRSTIYRGHDGCVVTCVDVSWNGKMVVSGDEQGHVHVWDLNTGNMIQRFEGFPSRNGVKHCCFSANDYAVMASDSCKTVRAWSVSTGKRYFCKSGEGLGVFPKRRGNQFDSNADGFDFVLRSSAMKLHLMGAPSVDPPAIRHTQSFATEERPKVGRMRFTTQVGESLSPKKMKGDVVETEHHHHIPEPHVDEINAARFSRDAKIKGHVYEPEARLMNSFALSSNERLAAACADGTIRIYDSATGTKICVMYGHSGPVNHVVYSASDDRLISCSEDGTVRIWNPRRARMVNTMPHSTEIKSCSFAPNMGAKLISVSVEGEVSLWNTDQGRRVMISEGLLAEQNEASGGTQQKKLRRKTGIRIQVVEFSKSGKLLITLASTLRLWEVKKDLKSSPEILGSYKEIPSENVGLWALSPCERLVAIVSIDSSVISCWDARTALCKCVHILEGHSKAVSWIDFSHDGRFLYSAAHDGTINVWNAILLAHNRTGGRGTSTLTNGQEDLQNKIEANLASGLLFAFLNDSNDIGMSSIIHHCAEAPHGNTILSISDAPSIKLWDIQRAVLGGSSNTGAVVEPTLEQSSAPLSYVKNLRQSGDTGGIACATWAPHGRLIASGSIDGSVRVWDVKSCKIVRVLRGHISQVSDVRFMPDGLRLVSISMDFSAHVWNTATGDQDNSMILSSALCALSLSKCGSFIGIGDQFGDLRILRVEPSVKSFASGNTGAVKNGTIVKAVLKTGTDSEGLALEQQRRDIPIVTASRRVLLTLRGTNKWDNKCRATCVYCANHFMVKGNVIEEINREQAHTAVYGPSAESFNNVTLVVRCDSCKGFLRCNPFVVDRQNDVFVGHGSNPTSNGQKQRLPTRGTSSVATLRRATRKSGNQEAGDVTHRSDVKSTLGSGRRSVNSKMPDIKDDEVEDPDVVEHNRAYTLVALTAKEMHKAASTCFYDTQVIMNPFQPRSRQPAVEEYNKNACATTRAGAKSALRPSVRNGDVGNKAIADRSSLSSTKSRTEGVGGNNIPQVSMPAPLIIQQPTTVNVIRSASPLARPILTSMMLPPPLGKNNKGSPLKQQLSNSSLMSSQSYFVPSPRHKSKTESASNNNNNNNNDNMFKSGLLEPLKIPKLKSGASGEERRLSESSMSPTHSSEYHRWLETTALNKYSNESKTSSNLHMDFGTRFGNSTACMTDLHYLKTEGPILRTTHTASIGSLLRRKPPVNGSHSRIIQSAHDLRVPENLFSMYHSMGTPDQTDLILTRMGTKLSVDVDVINFGALCANSVYRFPIRLLNVGATSVRFRVGTTNENTICPEDENVVLRIMYADNVTSIIPGISVTVFVDLEVHKPSVFESSLFVSTSHGKVIRMPIRARVLAKPDYASTVQSAAAMGTPHVTNQRVVLMQTITGAL